jgi:hypothetical protein
MGYKAKKLPADPSSYEPLDTTLGMNGTTKYTNWGITPTNKPEPAYNPAAVPPPLCLQSNYSEAQNGAGGYANWPCTFKFPFICKTMGGRLTLGLRAAGCDELVCWRMACLDGGLWTQVLLTCPQHPTPSSTSQTRPGATTA